MTLEELKAENILLKQKINDLESIFDKFNSKPQIMYCTDSGGESSNCPAQKYTHYYWEWAGGGCELWGHTNRALIPTSPHSIISTPPIDKDYEIINLTHDRDRLNKALNGIEHAHRWDKESLRISMQLQIDDLYRKLHAKETP